VYYSRVKPADSETNDPREALVGELIAIGLAAFFIPPVIIGVVYLNRKNVRKLFLGA
jgi:hypothetical protein